MKTAHRLVIVSLVVTLAYFLAHTWFASAWSERFWSWLNHTLSRGVDPGLASDAEMIIVLLTAPVLALGIALLLLHIARIFARTPPSK